MFLFYVDLDTTLIDSIFRGNYPEKLSLVFVKFEKSHRKMEVIVSVFRRQCHFRLYCPNPNGNWKQRKNIDTQLDTILVASNE